MSEESHFESRILNLEQRMVQFAAMETRLVAVEKSVDKLGEGLFGSVNGVGALELVRTTSTAVSSIEKTVGGIKGVVDEFSKERLTLKGIMISVGLLCGFLSWASTFVYGWITK